MIATYPVQPTEAALRTALDLLKATPDYERLSVLDQMQARILVGRKLQEGPDWVPDPNTWRLFAPLKTDEEVAAMDAKANPTSPLFERVVGQAMDAADLLLRKLPDLRMAVDGVLPEGLGILAAPPKAGKSLLAYQLAVDLTLGDNTLGRTVEQRPVMYYALEDGERRSQARVLAALNGRTLPRGLMLRWEAPRLGGGLEDEVSEYLDEHPLGVVIIDVLAKVRPESRKTTLNAYDVDYATLADIHVVAKKHPGSVVLFVTHDRKAGSEDFVTRITGTRGVSGVADFLIFINRDRGAEAGTIVTTGRDVGDTTIPVRFTGSGWVPASLGFVVGTVSETRDRIFKCVERLGPVWQAGIAKDTGLSKSVVDNRVSDMARDGQLLSTPSGYIVPPEESAD